MTIHNIEFQHWRKYYDDLFSDGSTIVAAEQAAPWESNYTPITNQTRFLECLNEAIALREAQLKYLTGLKIIAQYVPFEQLRKDAEERGSLEAIVNEFWKSYEES